MQTTPGYSLDIQARMNQEDKQRNYEMAENLLSEQKFAVAASVYTIAGCVLGNVFRGVIYLARENAISPLDVFRNNTFSVITGWSVSYVSFVDLVFWFVAVWFAVFLVKRPLSRAEKLAIGMYELKG